MQESLDEMKTSARSILEILNFSSTQEQLSTDTRVSPGMFGLNASGIGDLKKVLRLWASCQPNRCGYGLDAWPPGELGSIGYFEKMESGRKGRRFVLLEKVPLETLLLQESEQGVGRDVRHGIGKIKKYGSFSFREITNEYVQRFLIYQN